jgi:hypothetical protein
VREKLRSLPKTLDETYDRILVGLSVIDRAYAFRTPQWLVFSSRPVTIYEVAEAMVVDLDCDLPYVDRDRALRNPHDLLDICAGLVRLSRHEKRRHDTDAKGVLELAHFSVKEYLMSSRIEQGPAAEFELLASEGHKSMAECCLAYLLTFECSMSDDELSAHPLARYSANFWPIHTRQVGQNCDTIDRLGVMLLSPGLHRFENCLRMNDDENWLSENEPIRHKALYYMALHGILSLARTVIKGGVSIDARGGKYGSPLQAASTRGHLDVVRLLLDHGADANPYEGLNGHAIQAASAAGNPDVVRLLLDHGADANAHGIYHEVAL